MKMFWPTFNVAFWFEKYFLKQISIFQKKKEKLFDTYFLLKNIIAKKKNGVKKVGASKQPN